MHASTAVAASHDSVITHASILVMNAGRLLLEKEGGMGAFKEDADISRLQKLASHARLLDVARGDLFVLETFLHVAHFFLCAYFYDCYDPRPSQR